jgi:hypothetical protein
MSELMDHCRSMQGEPDNWADFHALMLAERRLVLRIHPERGYGFKLG